MQIQMVHGTSVCVEDKTYKTRKSQFTDIGDEDKMTIVRF